MYSREHNASLCTEKDMNYDTFLFDLDGTLLDTLQDLHASVNAALRSQNRPERSLEEVRSFVGNGVRMLMKRSFGGKEEPGLEVALKNFKAHYAAHCLDLTHPYAGIPELLHELRHRGFKMGVVSNKTDAEVKALCRKFFGETFQTAIGEREGVRRKPAPDTIFQALKELGSEASSALYIGDSDIDLETARNAGLDCVSVTWGFRSPEQLQRAGAKVLIDTPLQILDLL